MHINPHRVEDHLCTRFRACFSLSLEYYVYSESRSKTNLTRTLPTYPWTQLMPNRGWTWNCFQLASNADRVAVLYFLNIRFAFPLRLPRGHRPRPIPSGREFSGIISSKRNSLCERPWFVSGTSSAPGQEFTSIGVRLPTAWFDVSFAGFLPSPGVWERIQEGEKNHFFLLAQILLSD
jgi:hypothetical protein